MRLRDSEELDRKKKVKDKEIKRKKMCMRIIERKRKERKVNEVEKNLIRWKRWKTGNVGIKK